MNRQKPIILIVDDNHKNIQIAGKILRHEIDCNLSFATDGIAALAQANEIKPDLILLDVMMPELGGIETCKKLKSIPSLRSIPVIFLSAKSEEEDIVRGFEVGAEDYVTKPFRPAELIARVRTHLALKQKTDKINQINNEQKELLHILCHDLINVLFPIRQAIPALQINNDQLRLKEKILQLAKRGLDIIELIRRMRVLEEGKLVLTRIPLAAAVKDSLLIIEERLKDKDLRVQLNINPSLFVRAEPTSLVSSVLLNVLTNAIKFSYHGQSISISAAVEDPFVTLAISDQGTGMSEDILENVFDFSSSRSLPGTTGETGSGFGLPLVKKFMEKYGGEIQMSSHRSDRGPGGNGTTVALRFLP